MLSTLVATGVLFFSMIAQAAMNEVTAPIVETQVSTKEETQIELPSSAFFFTADIETNQELVEKILEEGNEIEAERKAELERLRFIEEERKKLEDAEIAQKEEIERQIKLRELEEKRVAEEKAREAEKKRLAEEKKAQDLKLNSNSKSYNYEATFYTAFCPTGCVGKTASGYDVSNTIYYKGMRIVAMPKNIPLHTQVLVTLNDGTKFKAIVLDRGGDIKGSRIDILVASRDEAYRLGRQKIKVEILN